MLALGADRMPRRLVALNDRNKRIGEQHGRAKLTDADVALVLELRAAGLSYGQIAKKFDDIPGGVGKSTIFAICSGRIRGQIPTRWK